VLTGFRVHLKGAQGLYGVTADIVCFGKALAGGMPVGAYGGRTEIMDNLAPTGSVYQAGTFSGNPVTMAGGVETLRLLSDPAVYDLLEARSRQLEDAVVTLARLHQLPLRLQRVGSMFSILFCEQPVRSWSDSLKIDRRAYARFFHALLDAGIYLPPSSVDAACLSAAHSEKDIEETVSMVEKVLCDCFSRG